MQTKLQRNETLECCRIVAAVFVVFLHVPFPGLLGKTVNCLARFAVPLFFSISGWFSYGAKPKKLLRRMGKILLLEAVGIGLTVLSRGFQVAVPGREAMMKWLLLNVDPFAGHLWYLSAMAWCYGALWGYTRIFCSRKTNYRPLYVLSGILLACHFAMANFSEFTGIRVEYIVYRNAWFFGIPMFAMGLLLKEYAGKLCSLRLWPVLILGFGLSLLERWLLGPSDLPVAMPLAVAAILLLTAAHPALPENRPGLRSAAAHFGSMSTVVYIIHLIISEALPVENPWLRPVAVAALSVMAAAAWVLIRKGIPKIRN